LNNRLVNFVGVLSYSLYLWQQPFLDRTQNHLWTSFPLNIGLAVGCAYLSYRLVEQPMLRFKVASTRRNKIREKSALSEMPVEEPTLTRA
jgi:peptidoglycan/LPS O-acetylase OafA/YrhL